MKKIFSLLIISMCIGNLVGCTSYKGFSIEDEAVYNYEDVKDILIRFHVIANSDNDNDQNLKLKVRDEVIKYLYPLLKNSKSIEESRQILLNNSNETNRIARQVIKNNGYNYDVKIELSHENFPEKSYGKIVLPQGNYEAFRIIIGSGEGHNWWCVMFPPMCLPAAKGDVKIEDVLNEKEENLVESSPKIEMRFKIVELFEKIFEKTK